MSVATSISFPETITKSVNVISSDTLPSLSCKAKVTDTLLGILQECREIILEMLLQNKSSYWNDKIIDRHVKPIRLSIPWVRNADAASPYRIISRNSLFIGNVQILQVCHQLCSEGKYVLYGSNSFESYNFPKLKYRLHAVIGRQNMSLIQKVTIVLPMKHKRTRSRISDAFWRF